MTKSGMIRFYSSTPIEDITAVNKEVGSIINSGTGELVITMKMTDFSFKKKLMQEHFNDNYVESHKFPQASFRGFIQNNEEVDYSTVGSYSVTVSGDMTIHGETQAVSSPGTLEVRPKGIIANAKFLLNPEDYGIKIPAVVRKNIAERLEITVDMEYTPMDR
jgi:polyisoprenoid-binding protein YceI